MANNKTGKDASGTPFTYKTTDNAGVDTPHTNVDNLPSLPAGTNNIGDVDVLTVPADPFGANADAVVAAGAAGSMQAKLRRLTTDIGAALTELQNLTQVEDVAHASGDTGVMMLGVRQDTPAALAGTTGDYSPISIDANGYLRVNVAAGSAAGTEYTEGDTDATISGVAVMWEDTGDTLRPVSTAKPLPTAQQGTANVAWTATEVHGGKVGGETTPITPVVTVSTTPAYTAGDTIGGAITLTNAMRITSGSGVLQSLMLFDAANQKPAGNILIFDAALSGTYTDNAAPTWNTADFAKCLGQFPVASGDWVTVNSRGIGSVRNIGLAVAANGSQNLYAVFVTTSTPTFAATSDLTLRFTFLRD